MFGFFFEFHKFLLQNVNVFHFLGPFWSFLSNSRVSYYGQIFLCVLKCGRKEELVIDYAEVFLMFWKIF